MGDNFKKIGNFSFVDTAEGQYAINMNWSQEMSRFFNGDSQDWDGDPVSVAGVRVVPWGIDNNLPDAIRDLLEKNNLGPGILDRKTGLLYGQGPLLYRVKIENNERVQEWIEDEEIQDWLDSWDYRGYIRDALVEYTHMNGQFSKYYMAKGVRIGRPWVNRLECLHSRECRLIWPDNDSRRLEDVKGYLTGDFDSYRSHTFLKYPAFDKWHPAKHETAVKYHCLRSFGRSMYAISCFYGSVPWLENANNLPEIIRHLNENMIAAAYVVHAPQEYWNQKRELVMTMHEDWKEDQIQKEMERLKDELTETIANVMAGKKNAGKFFSCVDFVDQDGNMQSWKIEPIEMNIDKYIEAQAKISRIADSSTTSGFGLSPALANIIIDGKSDSGSQMLYALKIFYGADTQIPEEIALEAINDAIRINFPNKKGVFLGIYRKVINKEDNVSAPDRPTNQV
ncbi:hypothetical protein AAE250_16310 [Bacteroides sp. GD17]|jgi:hypothetical protein|uniref:hypothetical protein n=1 Tax=Bacteroides sp. GD17 TaxID=3139826 RepID=UPI0020614F30|nr:hypothetical protein [uncultured Bacteroides sp.]DAV67196.1 MAG TPA: portal [Caudoviricetes sp.]